MKIDTVEGTSWVNPTKIVAMEQIGDDVMVMLDGGHAIYAIDTSLDGLTFAMDEEKGTART